MLKLFRILFLVIVISSMVSSAGIAAVNFDYGDPWWGGGFQGSITFSNDSDTRMEDWVVTFRVPFKITSLWGGSIDSEVQQSDGGYSYTVSSESWNGDLSPGASVNFGFIGQSDEPLNSEMVSDFDVSSSDSSGAVIDDGGSSVDDGGSSVDDGGDDVGGLAGNSTDTVYDGKRIVGYFVQWGIYGRDYQVADIPGHKLTHINYAFVGIDGRTLEVKSVDSFADFEKVFPAENGLPAQNWSQAEAKKAGNFGRLRQLKQKYPHLKVMLSVGGWTLSTFFSDAALTPESRQHFAASAVKMMVDQGLDGIDLDWEYPVSGGLPEPPEGTSNAQLTFEMEKSYQKYRPADRENYVLLLKEIRRQLDEKGIETGQNYLLTIATPAAEEKLANYDLAAMEPYLDFINVMAYDIHGGWENTTGHQAAMKVRPGDPVQVSVENAVFAHLAQGVPAGKIVVGLPFYGRSWEGVPAIDNGILQSSTGIPSPSGPGHWEAGVFDYWFINNLVEAGSTSVSWDGTSECSYAYGENLSAGRSGGMFITFDDVRSAGHKADYINSNGLGGAMFWELSGDVRDVDSDKSLLGALAAGLLQNGSLGTAAGQDVADGSGSDTSDNSSGDSGSTANDDNSSDNAGNANAPATPHIAWIDPDQKDGDYSITWNMWWGDNGVSWSLIENGQEVHSENIESNSPQAQSDSVELSGRDSGEYTYIVRLYSREGLFSESSPVTLTVAGQADIITDYNTGGSSGGNLDAVTDAGDGSRYTDDRDKQVFVMDEDLAFQIHVNQFATETFRFDKDIKRVVSRNSDVADLDVSANSITVSGLIPGRTGLRIDTQDGKTYFMGLRVDSVSGELPGLPDYLAVGSVSEDTGEDLSFWQTMEEGRVNKRMDIRYIYINGGPLNGWTSWGPDRARKFARESLKLGIIPFFVFYNIPDGGESYYTDLQHIQDQAYMDAYYENLEFFISEVTSIMKGELYGIILEPDFLGYMQQSSGKRPSEISTVDGSVADTVRRINSVIAEKGGNVVFGWQLNLWASAGTNGAKGLVRRTDSDDWAGMDWNTGREYIYQTAEKIAGYAVEAGVLSHGADFLSIDKYGLDAGVQNPDNPADSTWFWNCDHWSNYLLVVEALKNTSGLPVVLWQIPVGHINRSAAVSAYTAEQFPALTNTHRNYEDSAATWFLGDTFEPGSETRESYFSSDRAGDSGMSVSSGSITWKAHMQETAEAGAIAVLFGAGVGQSTDGVGSPPSDDYFWIQKVQDYYINGPAELSR